MRNDKNERYYKLTEKAKSKEECKAYDKRRTYSEPADRRKTGGAAGRKFSNNGKIAWL